MRKSLLARVAMTETRLEQLHEHGRLHVVLAPEAWQSRDAALDGSGAVLLLAASGKPVQLLLDDWIDPEEDLDVHFASVTFSLRWRDDEILIYAAAGSGRVDPWSPPDPALASTPRGARS